MALLGSVFKPLTDPLQLVAYREALDDLSDDSFAHGVRKCIRTLIFFPKPIEIREEARTYVHEEGRENPQLLLEDKAAFEERWEAGRRGAMELRLSMERLNSKYGTHLSPE